MQSLARRADSIDEYWGRFRTVVPPGRAVHERRSRVVCGLGRPPAIDPRDAQCTQWLNEITQLANGLRASMSSADETARAAAVYPGVRRDLRKKYKLEWDGWDR